MRKIKLFVLSVIAVISAVCCFALVACGEKEEGGPDNKPAVEYTVTWSVGEHATVKATGYDTLPSKLASGTEVTFTVTMDDGWALLAVAPTNSVAIQTDGSYKFTVTKNLEIKVLTIEADVPGIHDITWNVSENVTVTATGFAVLPQKLAYGSLVRFTAVPDEGYTVAVTPSTIVKQLDGSYMFAVDGDITVNVTATEADNRKLEASISPATRFYAGEPLLAGTLVVKLDGVTLEADDYTIVYQTNANKFVLGDTKITVKYDGLEKEVTLPSPVVGYVELNIADAGFAQEDFEALSDFDEFAFDYIRGIVRWTFTEPNRVAIPLPRPSQIDTQTEMFIGWLAENGEYVTEIAANTATTCGFTAVIGQIPFSLTEVVIDDNGSEIEETIDDYTRRLCVTPLRVTGKFVAATSVKLRLTDADGGYVEGDKVTANGGNGQFTAVIDIRDVIEKYGNSKYSDEVFVLYAVVEYEDGDTAVLPLKPVDYGFSVDLSSRSYYDVRTTEYVMWFVRPEQMLPIPDGCVGVVFSRYALASYSAFVNLETVSDGDNGEIPVLVVDVKFRNTYVRADAERILGSFIKDICVFNDWGNTVPVNIIEATLDEDWYYIVKIDLSRLQLDKTYVMHVSDALKDKTEGNFTPNIEGRTHIEVDGNEYDLFPHETGWGFMWPAVRVTNPNKTFLLSDVSLKSDGEHLYYVITYYAVGYTQEEIESQLVPDVFFDLQGNPRAFGSGNDWKRYKGFDVVKVLDEELGEYHIKIDLTTVGENGKRILPTNTYCYTTHFGFAEINTGNDGIQAPDFKPEIESFSERGVVFNGDTYMLTYTNGANVGEYFYGCVGLRVESSKVIQADKVQLSAENGENGYLLIPGTYKGYADADELAAAISVDYQNADNWATTVFTADMINVSVDEQEQTFVVKVDITSLPAGQYLIHFPNGSSDVGNDNGIDPVAYGNKTAAYVFRNFGTWSRHVLTITETV